MGLFDIFKKKEGPKPQNNPNSVFTMRFAIPYFPVFDKTDPKLKALPVKIACGGSVQYRIADPTLCFDNVPLGQMSQDQLEEHVKDSLIVSVKHFINAIKTIPLLQIESELMNINAVAKESLIPKFADEYGINLRAFTLTRISYDEDDPNYRRLCTQSAAISDKLAVHNLENIELDHEDEKMQRSNRRRAQRISDDEELVERENKLRLKRQAAELELKENENRHKNKHEQEQIELERKRRELDEDMHARRVSIESKAERMRNQNKAEKLGLDIFDEDTSDIDDSFDI